MGSYETKSKLPGCEEKFEGLRGFVKNDSAVYVCDGEAWEAWADAYASEDELPNCSSRREGSLAWLLDRERALVCSDGSWEKYVEQRPGSSSSRGEYDESESSGSVGKSSSSIHNSGPIKGTLYFLAPDDIDWKTDVVMISENGAAGEAMTPVAGKCGWFQMTYEDAPDEVRFYRKRNPDERIGLTGLWGWEVDPSPLPLKSILEAFGSDNLYFIPDDSQWPDGMEDAQGLFVTDPGVDGLCGVKCVVSQENNAVVVDVDADECSMSVTSTIANGVVTLVSRISGSNDAESYEEICSELRENELYTEVTCAENSKMVVSSYASTDKELADLQEEAEATCAIYLGQGEGLSARAGSTYANGQVGYDVCYYQNFGNTCSSIVTGFSGMNNDAVYVCGDAIATFGTLKYRITTMSGYKVADLETGKSGMQYGGIELSDPFNPKVIAGKIYGLAPGSYRLVIELCDKSGVCNEKKRTYINFHIRGILDVMTQTSTYTVNAGDEWSPYYASGTKWILADQGEAGSRVPVYVSAFGGGDVDLLPAVGQKYTMLLDNDLVAYSSKTGTTQISWPKTINETGIDTIWIYLSPSDYEVSHKTRYVKLKQSLGINFYAP